ncbi:hypothetical protein MASR2M44_06200 [Bacteroidota bacterium]
MKPIYTLFLVFWLAQGQAQEQRTIRIHFKSDEFGLDQQDRRILDSLSMYLNTRNYYELSINGHTDHDASNAYNEALSGQRATMVKNYLIEKGIPAKRLHVNWQGETKPLVSNAHEQGKQKNRRVDVVVTEYQLKRISDLVEHTTPASIQVYTVDSRKAHVVTAQEGTRFKIPENAFCFEDGTPYTGKVELEVKEILSTLAAIQHNVSTVSDGKPLESGGMFSFEARAEGRRLALRPGKNVDVEMPSSYFKSGMTLFTPVKNTNGVTEWKNTGQEFAIRPSSAVQLPTYRLNSKYLRSLKVIVDSSKEKHTEINWTYKFPKAPIPPAIGVKPKPYNPPVRRALFSRLENIFLPEWVKENRYQAELSRRNKLYQSKLDRYNRNVENYQRLIAKYKADSAAFEERELEKFRTWLAQKELEVEKRIKPYHAKNLNFALEYFATNSEKDGLTAPTPLALFKHLSNIKRRDSEWIHRLTVAYQSIQKLENKSLTQVMNKCKGQLSFILFTEPNREDFEWFENPLAMDLLDREPKLLTMFSNAEIEIRKKRIEAGFASNEDIEKVYGISIGKTGLYNCDKFSNIPPTQMAGFRMETKGSTQVYFKVPGINSLIYAYCNGAVAYCSLPKNMDITMIIMSIHPEMGPTFEKKTIKLSQNLNYSYQPKPILLAELKKELASL